MKISGWIGFVAAVSLWAVPAWADDFRIESKVIAMIDGKPVPQRENVTLFHRGIVYDYASNPQEITILDAEPSRARFILLNPSRQQKLEIKLSKIAELIDDVKKKGLTVDGEQQPFMRFVFNPAFKQSFDKTKQELVLDSSWMEYRISTMPIPSPTANDEYRQFSDWFAQLNTITSPLAMPPFARLQVNQLLHANGQLPQNVQLTLKGVAPKKKDMVLTSEHKVMWHLLEADKTRINRTDTMFVKFTAVAPEEFFKEDPPVPQAASKDANANPKR